MQEWTYKVVVLENTTEKIEGQLNELGKEGWELLSIENGQAFFKKPVIKNVPFAMA